MKKYWMVWTRYTPSTCKEVCGTGAISRAVGPGSQSQLGETSLRRNQ